MQEIKDKINSSSLFKTKKKGKKLTVDKKLIISFFEIKKLIIYFFLDKNY